MKKGYIRKGTYNPSDVDIIYQERNGRVFYVQDWPDRLEAYSGPNQGGGNWYSLDKKHTNNLIEMSLKLDGITSRPMIEFCKHNQLSE